MTKKPWLAGLLNVIPGLGYLYIDWKRPFGWYLTVGGVLLTVGTIMTPVYDTADSDYYSQIFFADWLLLFGIVSVMVAFILDAVMTAKIVNNVTQK